MLAGQGSAAAYTRPWFEVALGSAQYTGVYLPAMLLARFVGADVAIRILLSAVALLLPVAAWMLLGSFGRDRRLAVFAPALFHTVPLYIGVYNFVAAVPVAVMVIALTERELRAPSWWRSGILGVLGAALLYLHLSGLVIALGAAVVLAVTSGVSRGRKARALLPLAPAVALVVLWAAQAPAARPMGAKAVAIETGPSWQPPLAQVLDLGRFANVIPGRVDELAIAALVLIWIALVRTPGPRTRPARSWRLPLLAGGLLAAYLAAPASIGYVALIHLRAVPFLLLFALCSPAIASSRRTTALLTAAVAVQLAYGAKLATVYRSFDREVNAPQLEEVLASAEPGRRLISLMLNRKSKVVHFEPYLHFGLYYEVLRGGRVRFNFGELPWMPIRFRRDRPAAEFPLQWEFSPAFFDWAQARGDAEYVLVRTPDPDGDAADSPEPGPEFASGWDLVTRAGKWALFVPGRDGATETRGRSPLPPPRDGARAARR